MKFKYSLTRRQQKMLFAVALTTLLPLIGAGISKKDNVAGFFREQHPGYYHVAKVSDGDTIIVDIGGKTETIRMIGVDTPETHHPKKPVQCFGKAASEFTKKLIGNSKVRLEADPQDDNKDIYGRLLRYVYLPDGRLVNMEIISQGYGFAYTIFPFTKLEEFRMAAKNARLEQRGLWASCEIDDSEETLSTGAE